MKSSLLLIAVLSCLLIGCVPAPLLCFLTFSNYTKTYGYDFSKEELKDRIIKAYSYDKGLLHQNLGKTLIENESINRAYRTSVVVWLDKGNWDQFKSEIRQNTPDTLNLTIGKLHSSKQIQFQVVVQGDENKSSLTILGFTYRQRKACRKDGEYYRLTLSDRIEKKFISKLK